MGRVSPLVFQVTPVPRVRVLLTTQHDGGCQNPEGNRPAKKSSATLNKNERPLVLAPFLNCRRFNSVLLHFLTLRHISTQTPNRPLHFEDGPPSPKPAQLPSHRHLNRYRQKNLSRPLQSRLGQCARQLLPTSSDKERSQEPQGEEASNPPRTKISLLSLETTMGK